MKISFMLMLYLGWDLVCPGSWCWFRWTFKHIGDKTIKCILQWKITFKSCLLTLLTQWAAVRIHWSPTTEPPQNHPWKRTECMLMILLQIQMNSLVIETVQIFSRFKTTSKSCNNIQQLKHFIILANVGEKLEPLDVPFFWHMERFSQLW